MPKLKTYNQRMLDLMNYCLDTHVVKIEQEWFESIGFNHRNSGKLKSGILSFRIIHIEKACKIYHVSADWIFGLNDTMKRSDKKQSALDLIKEGVRMLENKGK